MASSPDLAVPQIDPSCPALAAPQIDTHDNPNVFPIRNIDVTPFNSQIEYIEHVISKNASIMASSSTNNHNRYSYNTNNQYHHNNPSNATSNFNINSNRLHNQGRRFSHGFHDLQHPQSSNQQSKYALATVAAAVAVQNQHQQFNNTQKYQHHHPYNAQHNAQQHHHIQQQQHVQQHPQTQPQAQAQVHLQSSQYPQQFQFQQQHPSYQVPSQSRHSSVSLPLSSHQIPYYQSQNPPSTTGSLRSGSISGTTSFNSTMPASMVNNQQQRLFNTRGPSPTASTVSMTPSLIADGADTLGFQQRQQSWQQQQQQPQQHQRLNQVANPAYELLSGNSNDAVNSSTPTVASSSPTGSSSRLSQSQVHPSQFLGHSQSLDQQQFDHAASKMNGYSLDSLAFSGNSASLLPQQQMGSFSPKLYTSSTFGGFSGSSDQTPANNSTRNGGTRASFTSSAFFNSPSISSSNGVGWEFNSSTPAGINSGAEAATLISPDPVAASTSTSTNTLKQSSIWSPAFDVPSCSPILGSKTLASSRSTLSGFGGGNTQTSFSGSGLW